MFLAGLGVGPTLSVFTIVVQNAVPFKFLGTATSNLTFFRQVGGSVGLAIVGSYFGGQLATTIPARLTAALPPALAGQFTGGSGDLSKLTNVGDLGPSILANVPEGARSMVEPLIPTIVAAIKAGIADAIGSIFWLAVVASLVAFVVAALIEEIPLRARAGAGAPTEL